MNKLNKHSVSKIVLNFHCLKKLFWWSKKFCKISAFSLKFPKFFSITKTIFPHSKSEQFWKQNTIANLMYFFKKFLIYKFQLGILKSKEKKQDWTPYPMDLIRLQYQIQICPQRPVVSFRDLLDLIEKTNHLFLKLILDRKCWYKHKKIQHLLQWKE